VLLGKFSSMLEFLTDSATTERVREFSADDYRAPFLQQAYDQQADRPISRWASYWQCSIQLQAARTMAALAAVVGQGNAVAKRQLGEDLERAHRDLSACAEGRVAPGVIRKEEAYWLYQATSKTLAIKRFATADEGGLQNDMENQRNWNDVVIRVQDIQ